MLVLRSIFSQLLRFVAKYVGPQTTEKNKTQCLLIPELSLLALQ